MSSMDWRQALLRWRIQFRRGTTDAWESANPVLLLGEPGWDVDLLRMKIGDGETAWNDLPWASLDPTQLQEILDLLEDLPDLDDERMSTVIADVGSDFFGLLSDYVESVTADYIPLTQRGANNGVATLDSGGKLPTSQLPTSVMDFKGAWNASTNSPTLVDGTGDAGDQYRVSVAGTRNLGSGSIVFDIGDAVIYSGTVWQKYDNTESVSSVAGKTGVVVLARADVGLDDAGLDTAMTGVLDDTGSDFTAGLNASTGRIDAVADGTTDDAAAFATLLAGDHIVSQLGAADYAVLSTVHVPWHKSLEGVSKKSQVLLPSTTGLTGNVLFDVNADTGAPDYVEYPGMPGSRIRNFKVRNNSGSDTPIAFKYNGYVDFEQINALFFDKVIVQAPGTYTDMTRIKRVYIEAKPDTANYAIDLTAAGGDGLEIGQIFSWVDPTSGYRPKVMKLRNHRGATIKNIGNGDIYIYDSSSIEVSASHMENGQVTFENASGSIKDTIFYMRDKAGVKCTPVILQQRSGESSFNGMAVELSNLQFVYTTALPGSYPTDGTVNFQIIVPSTTARMLVSVKNLVRDVGKATDPYGNHALYGVTCGVADFDDYSHVASVESKYRNGVWDITSDQGVLESSTGIASVSADPARAWAGTTGTYYYKVVGYLDKKRAVGRVGSSEVNVALTNGSNGALLSLASEFRRNIMIRVYRGASTGSYDKYVDVPLISGGVLADSGADIGGYAWVSRTAGAVDTVNSASLAAGMSLTPGEVSVASDAYGHAGIRGTASAVPTVGAFRRGDMVRFPATDDGTGFLIGYARATDCTAASPAHVVGTDWIKVYGTLNGLAVGTGSPNSSVVGSIGDIYRRRDGSLADGNLVYYKATGTATNTGWVTLLPKRGTGSPNSVVTGSKGDIFERTDGTTEDAIFYGKTTDNSNTGWVPMRTITPYTATTAQLLDATHAINTANKLVGKLVTNTDTGKVVNAAGGSATSVWRNVGTGATEHTPV